MTPDHLHYFFVATGWIAIGTFVFASLVIHRRMRSKWSALLLGGILAVLGGQIGQQLAPIDDLALDEFKGIVVSTGELPASWYMGSLVAAVGWLAAAIASVGIALAIAPDAGRPHR